jgi:hypothetical protein
MAARPARIVPGAPIAPLTRDRQRRGGQAGEHPGAGEALLAGLDDGRGEGGERDDGRHGPWQVDAAFRRRRRSRGVPPDQP